MCFLSSYIFEAKKIPLTKEDLNQVLVSNHPYHHFINRESVVSIISHSIQDASAYEATAKKLREEFNDKVSLIFMPGLTLCCLLFELLLNESL